MGAGYETNFILSPEKISLINNEISSKVSHALKDDLNKIIMPRQVFNLVETKED